MLKIIVTTLFLLFFQQVYSQDSILYELPKNIVEFIEQESKDTTQLYYIKLYHDNDNIYSLIVESYDKEDTTDLVTSKLINVTNRFAIIKNKIFPILIDTDFVFAFLGKSKRKRNGKEGRIHVLMSSEATLIRFDKYGRIIE